jgi:hypothetical protein
MKNSFNKLILRLAQYLMLVVLLTASILPTMGTPIPAYASLPPSIVGYKTGAGNPNYLGGAINVYVSGNYAYVCGQTDNSLTIVNISNPANPTIAGHIAGALNNLDLPNAVFVLGNYAYVASTGNNALTIVNISNPAALVVVSHLDGAGHPNHLNAPYAVFVLGNYAYVCAYGENSLTIVDVTNPAAPATVGNVAGAGGATFLGGPIAVSVSGNYAYVCAATDNSLTIVNVSVPAAPTIAGHIAGAGNPNYLSFPYAVSVSGNYAYVCARNDNSLTIVDVSVPAAPTIAGHIAGAGGATYLSTPNSVYVSGNYAYVASNGDNSLTIVDVINPALLTIVSHVAGAGAPNYLSTPRSVFVVGIYAYTVSNGDNAISIFDISPPPAPGTIYNPDSPTTIGTVTVYPNVLATGDLGVLLDFYTYYATLPTQTITNAYRVSFIDTDGVTALATIAPYTLLYNGYRNNMAWIYLSAAEVTSHTIIPANIASYTVKVYGNTSLTWFPGPAPTTSHPLDTWHITGNTNVLLALDVISYATTLQTTWVLHMIQSTPVGNRLTNYGAAYFSGVIGGATTAAPSAFYTDTTSPLREAIDYSTIFGAIVTDGTGTCSGSPVTLVSGANTVDTLTSGTLVLTLEHGTIGTAASVAGGSAVTSTPVALTAGINTITVTFAGTGHILITVQLQNTQTKTESTIIGTGFDLTTLAALFNMDRGVFSGVVWFILSIIICAAAYARTGGKTTLLIFDICIIGGAVLGLVPILVAALLFIGFGVFTGYILFFRNAIA